MLDCCTPLTHEEILAAPQVPPEIPTRVIAPVPDSAPDPDFHHAAYGKASKVWPYQDESGMVVGYMLRFDYAQTDGETGAEYLPLAYCETPDGRKWLFKGFGSPYPLYRLPEILRNPEATVLVCEGEKTADAAARFFPNMVVTTSPFGPRMAASSNWKPLKGRDVIVAPDLDEAGHEYAYDVVNCLYEAGAASVRWLSLRKVARHEWHRGERLVRESTPDGWDLADAANDGWTPVTLQQAIEEFDCIKIPPRPMTVDPPTDVGFRMTPEGIEGQILTRYRGDIINSRWAWICGPLEAVAITRDVDGKNWGKLVQVTDPDGSVSEVYLSNEVLESDGPACRGHLHAAGLKIASGRDERDALKDYLARTTTETRATTVDRMGWYEGCFMTPGKTVGTFHEGERTVMRGAVSSRAGYANGTLAEWQAEVAKYAVGNSRLAFAISTAFTPAILKLTGAESGGFHLVGPSSIGKSTALVMAGSVWGGGGGATGYIRPWRATANGLEGVAEAHCDALLCLDEIGQAKGSEVGQAVYMLANGSGKVRANRNGDARAPKEWRTIILSTGETTLAAKIGEEGSHAHPEAGQLARFADIPAVPAGADTLIEVLHEFPDARKLAQHLKVAVTEHYGHAWEPFVEYVTENADRVLEEVRRMQSAFVDAVVPKKADGQVSRVAARFGLVAAAGELAERLGILPWPTEEADKAAKECFADWLSERGTHGALEEKDAIACIRAFIEKHGSTRFAHADDDFAALENPQMSERVSGRVGVKRYASDCLPQYCFFREAWKEVCAGRDPKHVARALQRRGLLVGYKNELTYPVTVRTVDKGAKTSKQCRMYVVKEDILIEVEEVERGSRPLGLSQPGWPQPDYRTLNSGVMDEPYPKETQLEKIRRAAGRKPQ